MNNESAKWTHKSEYLWSCAGMPIKFNQSCSSQSQFLVRPSSLVEWNAPRSVHRTLDFGHRWASEAKWGSSSWALISAWDARETLGYGGVENTRGASLRWVEFTGWWVDNNHIRRWSALNKRYFILFSLCCLPAALCSFRSLQPPSCPSCFPSDRICFPFHSERMSGHSKSAIECCTLRTILIKCRAYASLLLLGCAHHRMVGWMDG